MSKNDQNNECENRNANGNKHKNQNWNENKNENIDRSNLKYRRVVRGKIV